jgi:hypothetical protein
VDWIHGGVQRCWPLAAVGAKKKQSKVTVLWVFFQFKPRISSEESQSTRNPFQLQNQLEFLVDLREP